MLGYKDKLGYNFEFEAKADTEKAGFGKYIVYANPQNPYLWKKRKQKGVDMVLHVGGFRIYVEMRFHSHFYHYRTEWFQNSTMQRFAEYPHTKYDYHVVLTNNTLVYETPKIKEIAESQGVYIYSFTQLCNLINNLSVYPNYSNTTLPINNITKYNNVYASNEYKVKNYQEMLIEALEMKRKETERLRLLYGG